MDTPRIRMGHDYGEVAPNTFRDFDWVHRNEKALFEKYGRCIAIVYQEQVIGTGQTYQEAVENAERSLPPEFGVITPILAFLHQRQPFYRVRPHPIVEAQPSHRSMGRIAGIVLALALFALLTVAGSSDAQETNSNFHGLIQRLVDSDTEIYVQFVQPTSEGRISWTIPQDIMYGDQFAGRRVFREVADDYLCVDEIGDDLSFTYCVPFSNIAYVSYPSP